MSGEYDYNEVVERIKKECTDGNYRWIDCDGKKCGADHHPECPHFAEPAQAAPSEEDIHLIGSALFYAIREIRDPALAALDRLRAALASERAKREGEAKQKHEMRWIDATPDTDYIARVLRAYLDENTSWSDNTLGLPPDNPLIIQMNKWQAERNALIKAALEKLASPAPDATALRELVDWARGTNHDSAECRMPSQSEVDARIAALASERAKREGEPMRCPSCGCVVDERGHGHHSAADCIFMHSYPAQPNETVLSEADAKLKAIDGSINCYPDKLVLIAKGRYEEYDDLATLLRSEPRGEEPR